jgi:hypothetical protein
MKQAFTKAFLLYFAKNQVRQNSVIVKWQVIGDGGQRAHNKYAYKKEFVVMKKLMITAFALCAVSVSAHASQCLSDISKVDASLPTAKVTDMVKERVMVLRTEAAKLHEAGKHKQSVQTLVEAKVLLGIE